MDSYVQDQINQLQEYCQQTAPKLIVWTFTYNHEPYLRDYFEGIIKQHTKFNFIAVVHDDLSTDNSAEIIKEYAEKYPDIIHPIYEVENQYSKQDSSLENVMNAAIKASEAEYVALCEGDDYWTDPLKLQKQVDYLDQNPDYGLVHTNIFIAHWKNNFKEIECVKRNVPNGEVYPQILADNFISTLSVVFRSDLCRYLTNEVFPIPYWDRILWTCFARHTKFHYLNDRTCVYRVLESSATHGNPKTILRTEERGTSDFIEFLKRNNIPHTEARIFLAQRYRKLLRMSYFAKDQMRLSRYWEKLKSYRGQKIADYICLWFWKLRVPSGFFNLLIRLRSNF